MDYPPRIFVFYFTQNRQGPVETPVIYKAVFDFSWNTVFDALYGFIKNPYRGFFVITGNHY